MQTKSYDDLLALTTALIGAGSLTDPEKAQILQFVNRRAHEAYQTSESWPRYMVAGEERTISTTPAQTVPYVEASKDNIAEFIRIHRDQPFLNRSSREFEFYVTSQGAHIMNISSNDAGSAFVTYKKEFTPFTATSTDIPQEWFYFIAHGAYADFLRVQDKQEEAIAEEQVAGTYLALELEKIDNRVNNTNLVNRFSTYVSRQAR
jgi:hypothetical protein